MRIRLERGNFEWMELGHKKWTQKIANAIITSHSLREIHMHKNYIILSKFLFFFFELYAFEVLI
jgi:hypothetical protein